MRTREISVVICAYTEDRWDLICAAVDSVRKQSLPSREIILVVDYNPVLYDRAVSAMPDVTVLKNQFERGLSGARNTGAAQARGSVIAFLDDDATAHEDWLKFLSDPYQDPRVMGVGGLILPRWAHARPTWLPEEFYWTIGCSYSGMPPSGARVRNLIGASMSFRRAALELVQEGFVTGVGRTAVGRPFGGEETEFCIKLGQRSPESVLVIDHRAMVSHFVSANRCTFRYFLSRCYAEGLSKAQVTAHVGRGDGLSAEQSYALKTLPLGVLAGVAALFRGDIAGIVRACAIVAGLAVTTTGYGLGRLGRTQERADPHTA